MDDGPVQNWPGRASPAAGAGGAPGQRDGALFSGTATVAAGLFTTLIVLFYLLVSGETFLRRLVEVLPASPRSARRWRSTLHIERNISAYLITVTLINFIVGLCTLAVMWACGVAIRCCGA